MMEKLYMKRLQHTIALTLSIAGGLYHMAWAAPAATELPTGEQDMKNATVTRDTAKPVMTIEQTKGQSKAFINWETFSIGKDAAVHVKQYSGADLLVNAVRGNKMSEIAGKLNATGNVALINPNGVIFMNGAQVNVGGLGVYATSYSVDDKANVSILNSGKEGSIEIQSGAAINAGVSAALANLSALNIAPKDYAIAIDSDGESGYTNRIHLVAEGNVDIQSGSTIKAKDYTHVGDSASVGAEGFNVGVGAVGVGGKIYIRSDRDADDYGSVIITHSENSKAVMQSANGVSIYTNAAQVDGDNDTSNGINAAQSRAEKGTDDTSTYYTKHDYKNIPSFNIDGTAYTDGTSVSVEGPGTTADKLSSSGADNKIATSYGGNGATTITTSLLVNNIDQLQDIEDGTYGNLDGRYVLGRDINAKDDEHSYIDDGILYKMTDGKLTKWSTKDGVAITGTKSGVNLSKTVDNITIGYSSDGNKATTTLSDGTILSNSNGTVGAENTQWSTTDGASVVTDKTAGNSYTIQSDKKSVVDQDGRTSNTAAKTVTDKDNTYTADIGRNTVTHTSDNSVTNTESKTVTKAAGTSDAGYTATITTDTAAGTSGTIAINDITYQVTDGKVGDTVTYGGSSVNAGTSTVTAGGVTTAVTENGTGTDGVKAGTVADDRVTVNGTTTTVNDGSASYQITTGTDAVTYTKGTKSASISGTKVTTGEVSADTSAGTVIKGDTTAVITSDTAGSVTYSGQDYQVADGTVTMTDSTTGNTVTVEGEDAENVLNIFSDAKTDLSDAKSIYSDYTTDAAKAQSLTKTLDAAIETLKEVTEKSTPDDQVQTTFQSAASQLQSDTALFNTASTALTNATTTLTQYNTLQKAISNNTELDPALKQAYDEFQSERLDDTTIHNIHSDKWDSGKGFNPLGSSDAPFTGTLDGFSGETVFGLYNLTINRPDEDNVGLISVAGSSDNAAAFNNIHLYSAAITGKDKVGTVAGTLQQGSSLSWSGTAGTVKGTESLGGLVGLVDGSSIWDSSSSATVDGGNKAGGIVGHAKGIYMYGVFNTNEDTPLSKKSQLLIGDDNKVIRRGDDTKKDEKGNLISDAAGKTITEESLQSNYGKVTGVTNTGGLVGYLEDAPDFKKTVTNINISSTTKTDADGTTTKEAVKDAPITNNVIDTSYNAGNIEGKDSTGGLVGKMTGGTLSNVYNADNNTVLRQDVTLPTAITSFSKTGSDGKTYAYSTATAADCANQTMTQYYSFFTVDDSGSRTYYYFIPAATESGTTQKGAGGIYVTADGKQAASLSSTSERYYFNRTFNKDANVTGTDKNTGSLVGSMTTTAGTKAEKYSSGSVIDSAYNAGTITGGDTAATGALVGSKDADSLINDSFYVTGKDVTNGKVYSNVDQAVGKSSTDTSKITNTAALDAVESKKKYYVSHDSKRGNFPGVQQKTDTDKDSSGNVTATYYEYTSGTKGSFYTDGTGSIASISHIYPITTTGTTDSSTGKTTYTSTRSTTAAYTKQADGTFQDVSGNTYTATYDTATRQIVLTPVSGSSSTTAATVVLNAVLAARTANETWTIYEDQTRPLLTAFLNTASLSRTFNYDGTTHNLKTDDVANLYGRADFDGDAGKDVQLSNYQLSSNGVSSEYTYDNTSIWSPQHGYFMDSESVLVINPVDMSANIYGTRVYGDIFNTRGYYVCVPYKDGSDQKYSFYKPADDGSDSYTLLEGDALQKLFGTETPSEDGLLKIAEQKGFYVLELNGFINGEGANNLGSLIRGLVTTLSNTGTDATKGNDLQHLFSNVSADTYLDAGVYSVTNKQITGLTATNQNYTINYGGTLTVKQAELYYTYDGSRTYGLQNTDSSATHVYTLVGVDASAGKDEKVESTHGYLKSWDLTGQTITIKNADGTETKIENPYQYFFTKSEDGTYQINQKYIGVTGYTAETTTTTTDVTTGESTTTTAKDETKSASLGDIYSHIQGTVAADSINKPDADSTTTSKVIGSYGDGAVSNDMYTHVLVDKDGNPIGYKVTSFASTNKDAGGTIQLYFKTDNAGDSQVTQAAVDKFNQNYKLVWKEGGTEDRVYTTGYLNNSQLTTAEDAGIKTTAGGLTVNDSTFTITPKTATVTITGHRAYGDTMDTSSYSTSTGAAVSGQDGEAKQYNVNIDGLTNGDGASVLDKAKTETLLSGIDKASGTAADARDGKEINKYTNVVRDGTTKEAVYQNINDFEKSKVSVVNDEVKDGTATDQMKVKATTTGEGTSATTSYDNPDSILTSNNYDYILQDGTHRLKITPVDIHVKVSGSKTYGDFTSQAATDYTASVSVSGGKTYDGQKTGQVQLKTDEVADIRIVNNLDEKSNAGRYTYDSSKSTDGSKAFTISLMDDAVNTDQNDYNADNYNISFDTAYTISPAELWYTYEGTRAYGADNTTTTNTFKLVGVDTADSNERVRGFLKSWDAKTYGVGTDQTISLTTVGDDKDVLYAMSGMADDAANKKDTTIRSITGGNSDSTYSHVLVDSTGKVIGYNLSSLGLSADDKLSLTDTTNNAALISRYTSVKQSGNLATDISYQGEKVYAYDLTKKSGNSDNTGSQITVTGKTEANHYDLLAAGNYDYTLQDGTHTLTIDRHDLNLNITAERQYGDISNQQYVSDYKSDAKPSGTTLSYATGVTSDTNGLQNGETIDFTKSTVALSDNFAQADAGTYTHKWYNDDTNQSADYSIGNKGITSITLKAGDGSAFDSKNYNIHYTTTYTIDKADLYYTYDGERNYGADNAAAAHTYTIVGKDKDSTAESVRGYLKSWDSGVLAGGNVLNNDLLKVTNTNGNGDGKAYTMTGVAIQDADTASKDSTAAANVTAPETSKSIGKDSGYSHVIVDKDGKILSYTLASFGTKLAGKDASGTLAKNYNLIWKQGGDSHQLDKAYTAADTASTIDGNGALQAATDTANKITVKNSSFKIDPRALTVTVTGQRGYGDSMAQDYTTGGTTETGKYNLKVTGDFANGETADSVLDEDNVKKMLASLENDATGDDAATRENSNGKDGKISKYTDVKRKAEDKSQIDSYSLNVGSTDTGSTITLASHVQTDDSGKVTSIKHANQADSSHGFHVLNDDNYDYVISEGSHTLTITPVDLTVNVKGESTYGKTDTTYTVTSTGAKNGENIVAGSETKSNLAANASAGSYTANAWTDKTGAITSKAPTQSGKYLNTAARRAEQSSDNGTAIDKGIYQVQLAAGTNTDGSGLSTFSANNYNITYRTTQVVNPAKLAITIDGTKVYGSQPSSLTAGNMTIASGELAHGDSLNGLNVADNMGQLTDAGTYRHNWSIYAGGSVPAESYTYTDAGSYGTESASSEQVLDIDPAVQTILGDDYKNYAITYQDKFTINPRTVRVTIAGESTYGETAPTKGEAYQVAFDMAGGTGVEVDEGLVGGQTIAKSQVTVQNSVGPTNDAGTYTTSQSDVGKEIAYDADNPERVDGKDQGIDGLTVTDGNGFKNKNYHIVLKQGTYTVNKRPLAITIKGEKTYGDPTSFSGGDYDVSESGLQNHETIDFGDASVVHSHDTDDRFSNAGEYHSNDGKGILGFDSDTLHGDGFKLGNYDITYDTVFVIDRRPVDVYMESRRTSGSPSSLRMDEPMQMRNVPQEHQGRFLSDLQVIDTAPQVIAAGDYPGDYLDEHGAGYLDLIFTGDIYCNYMIHRHTVYHILPDRMMKPSVYNAVQPVRRPVLDVMYLKVDGSEGINRWGGAETPEDDGAIILKDNGIVGSSRDNADRTSRANQSQPNPSEHLDQPTRPVTADGMGELHEEVEQAVPVIYTDGENKELGGRYHLAYENDTVVVRPTADAAVVPALRTASAAEEARKVLRVPYQGAEGEYEVAYADGIVQLYPKNDAARQLAEARGKDEQRLLQSGLESAVQQLGVQLEDVEAVYIYTDMRK